MAVFVYPRLPWKYLHLGFMRISGAGLGNLLFPWARAVVVAKRFRLRLIWPTWPQLYLSRRLDIAFELIKRHYIGYFTPTDEYVFGLKKMRILLSSRKMTEEDFNSNSSDMNTSNGDWVFVFEGMKNLFRPVLGWHPLIKCELYKIVSRHHRNLIRTLPWPSISVHVRMGDLPSAPDTEFVKENPWKCRLPLTWYINQIDKLRQQLGSNTPVYVFTDGSPWEMGPLMKVKNLHIIRTSAIADLLTLASSFVLVTSGSTFSMWAIYLGQCPAIWFPGWMRQKVVDHPSAEVELDFAEELPDAFCNFLKLRMISSQA